MNPWRILICHAVVTRRRVRGLSHSSKQSCRRLQPRNPSSHLPISFLAIVGFWYVLQWSKTTIKLPFAFLSVHKLFTSICFTEFCCIFVIECSRRPRCLARNASEFSHHACSCGYVLGNVGQINYHSVCRCSYTNRTLVFFQKKWPDLLWKQTLDFQKLPGWARFSIKPPKKL